MFIQFQKFVETQFTAKIKIFQIEGGTEFTYKRLQAHFIDCGIHHQISCPSTSAQNGRAERKYRHIKETGLFMAFHSSVPLSYLVDAFSASVYIINRLPSLVLGGKSSFELLFACIPDYSAFHPFGCRVYPCLRATNSHKFLPRSIPCVFIGYSSHHKGFKCLDLQSGHLYISRHAQFDEFVFPYFMVQISRLHLWPS